jgi:hypothetical protein
MEQPWGKKAVRIAISIGKDVDNEVLQKFIGNSELKPLAANSPEALVRHIKWASTAVLKSASSPAAGAEVPPEPIRQTCRFRPLRQPPEQTEATGTDRRRAANRARLRLTGRSERPEHG